MQITDWPEERAAIKAADGIIDAPEPPQKPEQAPDNPFASRIEAARQLAIKQAERQRLRKTRYMGEVDRKKLAGNDE